MIRGALADFGAALWSVLREARTLLRDSPGELVRGAYGLLTDGPVMIVLCSMWVLWVVLLLGALTVGAR